jgi:osmotically-inducible protein OsmY
LDGFVSNPFQKRLAEHEARDVVGVGWVTNHLDVAVRQREDRAIETDLELDLGTDATLEKLDLQVRVKDAVVTLSGTAHSWHEKEHATDLASRVWGVKSVINQIQLEEAGTKEDAELLKSIRSRLQQNATTSAICGEIAVSVRNRLVALSGDVKTWNQRKEAARIAMLTRGVSAVDNRLTVEGYDYPWDEWHLQPPSTPPDYNPFRSPYLLDDYLHRK